MGKTMKTVGLILLFTVGLFASTPTGTVDVWWANANQDGSCPTDNHNLTSATLDASGNYSVAFSSAQFAPGKYCIYYHYEGDSQHSPSDATATVLVVNNTVSGTTTTGSVNPNPVTQGQQATASGSVTSQ